MAERHEVAVIFTGGRYPYVPSCSCGWTSWGYVSDHAAQSLAASHHEEVTTNG